AEVEASGSALIFNCAQRAQQNTLENFPLALVSALAARLKYPIISAALCEFWVVSRVFYTLGYTTGDPSKVGDRRNCIRALLTAKYI
ncbi:hypothetical protein HYDPIDRAFT_88789, partial [Hydnomerulius pinastri MD-312]